MRRILIVAAAVLALGLMVVAVGGVTSAQEGDGPIGSFLSKVADKLDVSEEDLKTAAKEARLEMIDEGVAEGRLTPDQAERLKQRVEEGYILPLGEGRDFRHRVCRVGHLVLGSAATVLDMSKWDLLAELRDSTLAQVAEEQGVENFDTVLLNQVKADLDARVAEDGVTQEQADAIFGRIQENIGKIINGEVGPHHGFCRPRHHQEGEVVPEGAG
jgi:hypothetical protein